MAFAAGSGPDIRAYMPGRPDVDATLLDVSIVAVECDKHSKQTIAAAFAQREHAKEAKYGDACRAANQELLTLSASEQGVLSRTTTLFVDSVANHGGTNVWDARKRVSAAIAEANGASLHNAEQRAGLRRQHADHPRGRP